MIHPVLPRFTALVAYLAQGLLERDAELRMALVAACAGESVFLHGPPGTAKSLLARRLHWAFADAKAFDYLMGRFSTPEELFGPLSIGLLRDHDRYERKYQGYLPDADIVFLDEIWKAGPPIQNALLTALNEKVWRNGTTEVHLPLKCLVAASNEVSTDHESAAFWDRFLLRVVVEPLREEASFRRLLADSGDSEVDPVPHPLKIGREEWQEWQTSISAIGIPDASGDFLFRLRSALGHVEGHPGNSDRRWKKTARLLRALAFLHGRQAIMPLDLVILPWCLWDQPTQLPAIKAMVDTHLADFLAASCPDLGPGLDLAAVLGKAVAARPRGPLDIDGEYYKVEGSPLAGPGQELLVWISDWEELDTRATTVELFVHSGGRYTRTVRATVAKGSADWTLAVDGTPCTLAMAVPEGTTTGSDPDRSAAELVERREACLAWRHDLSGAMEAHFLACLMDPVRLLGGIDQGLEAMSLALEGHRQ